MIPKRKSQKQSATRRTAVSKPKQGSSISAPASVSKTNVFYGPSINGCTAHVIKNRELVTVLQPDLVDNSLKFPLNPGMEVTYPWLSNIAPCFETYQFRKLKFIFSPRQSSIVGGAILMATDYDASDAMPTKKDDILRMVGARSCSVWSEFEVTVDVKRFAYLKYFVRRSSSLQDIKTQDPGFLIVASTVDATATGGLGELWVEYEVELMTPQMPLYEDGFLQSWPTTLDNLLGFGTAIPAQTNMPLKITGPNQFTLTDEFEGLVTVVTRSPADTGVDAHVLISSTSAEVGTNFGMNDAFKTMRSRYIRGTLGDVFTLGVVGNFYGITTMVISFLTQRYLATAPYNNEFQQVEL